MEQDWTIRLMEERFLLPSLELTRQVFTEYKDAAEGETVRALVEEIRCKRYYLPALDLVMTDGDEVIGFCMFSRFPLEGRYEDDLLLLSPVAVKTSLQRRHISKRLLEYGFERARELGFQAVLVEGNPANYTSRGFVTSALHGIVPGPSVHLPRIECLMVKELRPGALEHIHGAVDYSFYKTLCEE